jgi:hypothetical protein
VESVGVENVISEDTHFRPEEAEDGTDETARTPDGPPQRDPRQKTRPTFKTTPVS